MSNCLSAVVVWSLLDLVSLYTSPLEMNRASGRIGSPSESISNQIQSVNQEWYTERRQDSGMNVSIVVTKACSWMVVCTLCFVYMQQPTRTHSYSTIASKTHLEYKQLSRYRRANSIIASVAYQMSILRNRHERKQVPSGWHFGKHLRTSYAPHTVGDGLSLAKVSLFANVKI